MAKKKGLDFKLISKILSNPNLKFSSNKVIKVLGEAVKKGDGGSDATIAQLLTAGVAASANAGYKGSLGSKHFAEEVLGTFWHKELSRAFRDKKELDTLINNLGSKELQQLVKAGVTTKEEVAKAMTEFAQASADLSKLKENPEEAISSAKIQAQANRLLSEVYGKKYEEIQKINKKITDEVASKRVTRDTIYPDEIKRINPETGEEEVVTRQSVTQSNEQAFDIIHDHFVDPERFAKLPLSTKLKELSGINYQLQNVVRTKTQRKAYIKKRIFLFAGRSERRFLDDAREQEESVEDIVGNEPATISESSNLFAGANDDFAKEEIRRGLKDLGYSAKEIKQIEKQEKEGLGNDNFNDAKKEMRQSLKNIHISPFIEDEYGSEWNLYNINKFAGTRSSLTSDKLLNEKVFKGQLKDLAFKQAQLENQRAKTGTTKFEEIQKLQAQKTIKQNQLERAKQLAKEERAIRKLAQQNNKLREAKIQRKAAYFGLTQAKKTTPKELAKSALDSGRRVTKARKATKPSNGKIKR